MLTIETIEISIRPEKEGEPPRKQTARCLHKLGFFAITFENADEESFVVTHIESGYAIARFGKDLMLAMRFLDVLQQLEILGAFGEEIRSNDPKEAARGFPEWVREIIRAFDRPF